MTEQPQVRAPTESEPIVVDDQSVSLDELTHWEAIFQRMPTFRSDPLDAIQRHVAIMFIDHLWARGEARRLGIEVSEAEVDELVQAQIQSQYGEPGALEAFLRESGQTMDDLRLWQRIARYSEVIRHHVTKDATSDEDKWQRIDSFMESYRAYWSARTRCRDPYFLADRCLPGDGTESPAPEAYERASLLRRITRRR